MSLQRFKEEVKGRGLARNNRFSMTFGLPQLIQKDSFNLEVVQLFCDGASIPGMNIASQPIRSFGELREMPYDRTFEPVTLDFYVDSAMVVKDFFDKWMNCVINPKSRTTNYYDEYVTDITLTVLDPNNQRTYQTTLFEAYPKTIQPIRLDNGNRDVMKLAVVFNYKYHTSRNFDVLSGTPEIYNMFNIDKFEGLNGLIPSNYLNAGSIWASAVPAEYLQNALSYNEQYADQISVANALSQIARRGFETGLGSIFR
jgi:hypothetical protein